MAEDGASQPTSADARQPTQPGARAGTEGRAAPPPTPRIPTRVPQGRATGSSGGGGLVDQIADRFEADEPETDDGDEDADAEDEDEGLLGRLRRRIGLGGDDADETDDADAAEAPEETEQTEPAGEPPAAKEDPHEETRGSDPVSVDVARPTAEPASRPARPTDAGRRVPARPDPAAAEPGHDGQGGDRRVLASVEAPGPAPPTGGDPVPGHPEMDGAPEEASPGFEDVDVPEPEVLHEQVDAVLDRYEGIRGRGSR